MEIEFRDICYNVRTHYGFGGTTTVEYAMSLLMRDDRSAAFAMYARRNISSTWICGFAWQSSASVCSIGFANGPKKQILHNVNGKFKPGELVGILGPSGAGKTSLLHILSGYKTKGVSGALLVNGVVRDERWFRRRSCYITQEDTLPAWMSVREAMNLASRLKGGDDVAVDELLGYLALTECADTRTELLSGGQRKRVAVALELVGSGAVGGVCFLDEPCSGLDDVSAARTQRLLRRLAGAGRTVIVTLHQPTAAALKLYHRIYIVAEGRTVYNSSPQALVPFLAHHEYHCPLTHNPADFIMELIDNKAQEQNIIAFSDTVKNGSQPFEQSLINDNPPEILLPSPIVDEETVILKKIALLCEYNCIQYDDEDNGDYAVSKWVQFWLLLQRLFLQSIRHKKTLLIQCLHYILNGVLLGLVFYDNANDGSMMYNHLKFCVGIVIFFSHSRLFIPVILFPSQVKCAKKEHFNRWYGTLPYYMAATLANLPVHLFFNCVYILIVYYLSGLPRELWKFFMYVVIGNCVSLCTEGIGLAVGSICSALIGSIIAPSLTVPFLCLAIYGFDFAHSISWFMRLVMRTSPMRCGLAAFVIVTFGYGRKPLRCDDVYCHFADPQVLLHFLDATDAQLWTEMAALVGNILVYRMVAYIALRKRFST